MQAALVPGVAPMSLKLTRTGTTFTGAWSTDAFTWHAIGTVAVPLAPDALAGLPVTSHNTTATTTATFGNVNVWR